MAQPQHTHSLAYLEEAVSVLFCLIDDIYAPLNPRAERYEAIKRLSDSEVITLALFQHPLPAVARGGVLPLFLLRDAQRFFSHLFSGRGGTAPFLFASTDEEAPALSGTSATRDPPRAGGRSADLAHRFYFAGSFASAPGFSVGGLGKLFGGSHMGKVGLLLGLRHETPFAPGHTNGVPISYELTPANVADVCLTEELLDEAKLGEEVAKRVLGDLAPTAAKN